MKEIIIAGLALVWTLTARAEISYPSELNNAAISIPRLNSILETGLLLGNGDLNGLLHAENGQLVLRVTKNDAWDARVLTENDPPLPTLKRLKELGKGPWSNRSWILPEEVKPPKRDSYGSHAYPCPRACAVLRLGAYDPRPDWFCHRPLGPSNIWERQGNEQVMSAEGIPGDSVGYGCGPLSFDTDKFAKLKVKLTGTSNARFYTEVMDAKGASLFGSGWINSPTELKELSFNLPKGKQVSRVILYTWTKDGKRAENRFESVVFEGEGIREPISFAPPQTFAGQTAKLDIARGFAQVGTTTTLRALAQSNAFLIQSPEHATLEAVRPGDLPEAEMGQTEGVDWIKQIIPGDPDWPGMTFAVALAQDATRKALAVVTSEEAVDPVTAAVKLASQTLRADSAATIRSHEKIWTDYWSCSGVRLEDAFLTATWYRNLYFLRCISKPGVVSPGLFAGLTTDTPAWHGDYHLNYNLQQTFWTAYNSNHADLAEPYDRLIRGYLPRAQWLAKKIYGMSGAYYPHAMYAYEPPHPEECKSTNGRQYIHHVWGMTLGVTGFTVQPLWWHYKYAPSRELLEKTVYPAIREAAVFYADFADSCDRQPNGKVILGPTVSPEHHGWTEYFNLNTDCAFDLAMVRYTLSAAIEGAGILGCDAPLVARWQQTLGLLPDYPTTGGDEPVVVDVARASPIAYNITVPTVPVFPGNVVTWWSTEKEKELFARTLLGCQSQGINSTFIMGVGRARLSLPGAADWLRNELQARQRPNQLLALAAPLRQGFNTRGHFTEQFAASMGIGELLLQSVSDIIRIFPAWPRDKDAEFTNLRAQGGFLVSAVQKAGTITNVEIISTVGGKLRLLDPWTGQITNLETKAGEKITVKQSKK